MSTTGLTKTIAELSRKYNAIMAEVPGKTRRNFAHFDSFLPTIQGEKLLQARSYVTEDYLPEADKILRDIASEKREVPKQLAKLMFPAITSPDVAARALGESQLLSARAFLETNPDAARIGREARESLALGRTDAAWHLIQWMRDAVPSGGPVNDEQRAMERELFETLDAAGDELKGIAELEKERDAFPIVERVAAEVREQIQAGRERVVVADLWPLMSEDERSQALQYAEATGSQLEKVSIKRKVFEISAR